MANDLTNNPLVVDTADAGAILNNPVRITAIVWDSGTSGAAGDRAIVKDKNSKLKWSATLGVAKDTRNSPEFSPSLYSHGLIVPTLSNGTLLIYLEGQVPKT